MQRVVWRMISKTFQFLIWEKPVVCQFFLEADRTSYSTVSFVSCVWVLRLLLRETALTSWWQLIVAALTVDPLKMPHLSPISHRMRKKFFQKWEQLRPGGSVDLRLLDNLSFSNGSGWITPVLDLPLLFHTFAPVIFSFFKPDYT